MARLTINSYQGENFSPWFNDEITGKKYFDVSDWSKAYSSVFKQQGFSDDQITNAWSVGKKQIRFALANVPTTINNNGVVTTEYNNIYAEWGGKFKVTGDRVIGGKVTRFSRDWGRSAGNIDIAGINYNLKKEMGSLWSLTLPNEITDHFDGTIGDAQYDNYGRISNTVLGYVGELPAGSTYDFSTPYG